MTVCQLCGNTNPDELTTNGGGTYCTPLVRCNTKTEPQEAP